MMSIETPHRRYNAKLIENDTRASASSILASFCLFTKQVLWNVSVCKVQRLKIVKQPKATPDDAVTIATVATAATTTNSTKNKRSSVGHVSILYLYTDMDMNILALWSGHTQFLGFAHAC